MPALNLNNITIKKLEDKNFNTYFLIVDNNNDNAYFCFQSTVKSGWNDLVNNYQEIKEIEIEFEEQEKNFKTYKKVVSLYTREGEIII